MYDLLSQPFKDMADNLIARFHQPHFGAVASDKGFKLHMGPRGSPENVGSSLCAHHPFVRTNPVTGWKSIFGLGFHFKEILNLNKRESKLIKAHILELVTTSHAAQVRFRWHANDLAIWDNVSLAKRGGEGGMRGEDDGWWCDVLWRMCIS